MNVTWSDSCLLLVMVFLTAVVGGCNNHEIAVQKTTAVRKAEGRWRLIGITSGWTGKSSPPDEPVELVIDNQGKATVYQREKAVLTFQLVLEEVYGGLIRYSMNGQTGSATLFYPPPRGNFRVSNSQLIMGDTGVDGNDYTFEKK